MNLYDITVKNAHHEDVSLKLYEGKVLLIVNTATHCGFTPQYEGLERLYKQYQDHGFEILDFPCNQFANQAPENIDEIHQFCDLNYHTTFPLFDKIDVNGPSESPLYTYLKSQKKGFLSSKIKWNFTKFLIDRQGNVIARFSPDTKPEELASHIEKALKK